MRRVPWLSGAVVACVVVATAAVTFSISKRGTADNLADSDEVRRAKHERTTGNYRRLCLPCHGTTGAGDGPASPWLWPRPRNFTQAQFKWRSTDTGKAPTRGDLTRTIRYGVPGTSMHGFGEALSAEDIDALVDVIIHFAPQKFAEPAVVVAIPERPAASDELLAEGKAAYAELGCDKCHGAEGKGDGPAAKDLKKDDGTPETTYDLTTHSFRRPRATDDDDAAMIFRSLQTGLTGTPMPSFSEAATPRKLWAIASYVATMTAPLPIELNRSSAISDEAAGGRGAEAGYWPGTPSDPDAIVWGHTLELQGDPPAALAPAQASLSAEQCARCHASQYRDWGTTLHGTASSPGLMAQLVEFEHNENRASGKFVEDCLRCHAPLAEQAATLRPGRWGGDNADFDTYKKNPEFRPELQAQGISCAACHVRKWERHGPPRAGDNKLLATSSYPLRESDHYERSDFCLGCHQLEPSNRLGKRPLLNTYIEWVTGPYFARGVQCQHCHMPNREHTWKGIHDPETFRQGMDVSAVTQRAGDSVSVRVRIKNVGAGHYLPTTPTPAAFVAVELLDSLGRPIPGAKKEQRIGRYLKVDEKTNDWIEVEDTRIPPGEYLELPAAWQGVADATEVLVTVRVEPDEFYERMYRGQLAGDQRDDVRSLYEQALAAAVANKYIALTRRYPID